MTFVSGYMMLVENPAIRRWLMKKLVLLFLLEMYIYKKKKKKKNERETSTTEKNLCPLNSRK